MRPLVDAINLVLSRLRHSIERERAFTADAAHELKTPLAAIKVQAQVALAEPDAARRQLAIERVVQGVDRGARLAGAIAVARAPGHARKNVDRTAQSRRSRKRCPAGQPAQCGAENHSYEIDG